MESSKIFPRASLLARPALRRTEHDGLARLHLLEAKPEVDARQPGRPADVEPPVRLVVARGVEDGGVRADLIVAVDDDVRRDVLLRLDLAAAAPHHSQVDVGGGARAALVPGVRQALVRLITVAEAPLHVV